MFFLPFAVSLIISVSPTIAEPYLSLSPTFFPCFCCLPTDFTSPLLRPSSPSYSTNFQYKLNLWDISVTLTPRLTPCQNSLCFIHTATMDRLLNTWLLISLVWKSIKETLNNYQGMQNDYKETRNNYKETQHNHKETQHNHSDAKLPQRDTKWLQTTCFGSLSMWVSYSHVWGLGGGYMSVPKDLLPHNPSMIAAKPRRQTEMKMLKQESKYRRVRRKPVGSVKMSWAGSHTNRQTRPLFKHLFTQKRLSQWHWHPVVTQ